MIKENLNKYIADAMKSKEAKNLEVLRLIKAELTKAEKDGIEINDASELKILLKMVSQREDSIAQYEKAGRNELAENEKEEIVIIKQYIPEQPTDEDILNHTLSVIETYKNDKGDNYVVSMKDMKPILSEVQKKYPTANGKIVSKALQNYIKGI